MDLLEGAVVAGDPFDVDVAAAAAGLAPEDALEALDALVERSLVVETDVPRRFRHTSDRDRLYAALDPSARPQHTAPGPGNDAWTPKAPAEAGRKASSAHAHARERPSMPPMLPAAPPPAYP